MGTVCGDVVFENISGRRQHLEQIYQSKYVGIIIVMILILYNTKINTEALKPNFMSSLLLCAVFH